MCVKRDLFKRFYVILDISPSIRYPSIVGIRPDYPLYHQIYEATKSDGLLGCSAKGKEQLSQLGLSEPTLLQNQFRMYPIEIEKSYFHSVGNPSCKG